MREILFRGKRMDNGEWIYGTGVCSDGITTWLISNKENTPVIFGIMCERIDSETVCQWTGLVDKNGVKIFEGDKVRYPDSSSTFNDDEVNEGFVEWDAECMCFYFTNRFIIEMDEFDIVNGVMVDVEVIGNIHDKEVEE